MGVTFEAYFEPETGEFEFFNVEPFTEGLSERVGDIVSIPQPGYCEQTVVSDGTIGSNPPETN